MIHLDSVAHQIDDLGIDSVYMLLHPGWEREARANRWHFAKRWSRYRKVVIVSPDLPWTGRVTRQETRLPNCRILKVAANHGAQWRPSALVQIKQLLDDMVLEGHSAPLLWIYNANFAEALAALPAAARVHHITENYFDFPAMSPDYIDRVKTISSLSDLNVAVSEGCAEPLRGTVGEDRLLLMTNGCDFGEYGAGGPTDPEVQVLRRGYSRLAVFAGNINDRLDFGLIERLAAANPSTLLLFVGQVQPSPVTSSRFKDLLRRHNVKSLGPVHPDRLPAIYRAADLGFIPYKRDRLLVNNGFPLKALEMAATGLPVISSFMHPIAPYSPPLSVAADDTAFLHAFSKSRREPQSATALRKLAAANDYDLKFNSIINGLNELSRVRGQCQHVMPIAFANLDANQMTDILNSYLRSPCGRAAEIRFRCEAFARRLLLAMPTSLIDFLRQLKWFLYREARQ